MTAHRTGSRRGQPLVVLTLVLAGWAGARAFMLADGDASPATAAPPAATQVATRTVPLAPERTDTQGAGRPAAAPLADLRSGRAAPVLPPLVPPYADNRAGAVMPALPAAGGPAVVPPAAPIPASSARIAAGHQILFLAALARLPMPELARAGPAPVIAAPPAAHARRWSGDAWLLLRRGGNGFNLPGAGLPGANLPSGAYGASQAGAVIRYRLAPGSAQRPELYLRATSALHSPRGEELAAGLALRPARGVPIAALVQGRATRTMTGTLVRPAAALVSELPPAELPFGLRGEAYVQAGYVGGRGATAFADGQGRIERRLVSAGRWQLRAGAGAWGGAQKGANRIDVGPTATLDVPLGPVSGRLAADWRFRIGGNAAPTSGPAITLSAGF